MHCFELGQTVQKGLLLQRDPHAYITTPEGSCATLVLAKDISDPADRIPKYIQSPLRLKFAEMEIGNGVIVLKRDYRRHQRHRHKVSALVRVHTAGGAGGVARLLASSFDEIVLGRSPREEVGRNYHKFPPAGVHPFCDNEHLKKVREGVEILDVLMLMQPGAGFRIHRTGDLKDQFGESESAQIAVRWSGYSMTARGYDDRIPVLNPLPEALPVAAE